MLILELVYIQGQGNELFFLGRMVQVGYESEQIQIQVLYKYFFLGGGVSCHVHYSYIDGNLNLGKTHLYNTSALP